MNSRRALIRYTDPVVTIDTDDWGQADGARINDDNTVTPVIDLRAVYVEIDGIDGLSEAPRTT